MDLFPKIFKRTETENKRRIIKMNFILKTYIHSVKASCLRLGFNIRITETPVSTMALLSNPDSNRVALVTFGSDGFNDLIIRAYLINRKKYQWASDEGFTLCQMLELEKEHVFVEIHPKKLSHYLI